MKTETIELWVSLILAAVFFIGITSLPSVAQDTTVVIPRRANIQITRVVYTATKIDGKAVVVIEVTAPPGAVIGIEQSEDLKTWHAPTAFQYSITGVVLFAIPADVPMKFFRPITTRP